MRQLGYALDNEENELGVRCIAAAIPDYRGPRVLRDFAVCAGQPHDRPARGRLRAPLMAARDEIARALGGSRF